MSKKIEIKECPYCGNKTFSEGRQMGQGNVQSTKGVFKGALSSGTPLYHTICLKCGSVVHSYVEKVDIFE